MSKYLTTGGKSSHAHGCSLPETMDLMCLEKIKNRGFTRVRVGALPSIILLLIFRFNRIFLSLERFYINMKVCGKLSYWASYFWDELFLVTVISVIDDYRDAIKTTLRWNFLQYFDIRRTVIEVWHRISDVEDTYNKYLFLKVYWNFWCITWLRKPN